MILAKDNKGNLICSPISVLLTSALLQYGANGETSQQVEKAFNLPMMKEPYILKLFFSFIRDLNNAEDVEFNLANGLFFNNHFKIKELFRKLSTMIFKSEIHNLNFQNEIQSAGFINTWCREKTRGKISYIVKDDDLTYAQSVLVNAIYFKGVWESPFFLNRIINFHISNTTSVPTNMMCTSSEFNRHQILNGTAEYIELPYKTDQPRRAGFSMYIILPVGNNGLDDIIDEIFKIKFVELSSNKSKTILCMPKFRIESNLELTPILKQMGISNMFEDNADFSRMTYNNVKISKIIQKAFISVDENGSEAAAATAEITLNRGYVRTIHVNKPFISVIVSKASGTPLFWARVDNPSFLNN
ncbi:hypothetical protein PV326_010928 [Microctonus aethiopoides]|nr:hypothetical protein PV326_010928 [Microctonus aethiopoides]